MDRSCKDTCVVCREQRVTAKESGMKRINAAKVFLVGAMMCGMAVGTSAEVVA